MILTFGQRVISQQIIQNRDEKNNKTCFLFLYDFNTHNKRRIVYDIGTLRLKNELKQ